MFNAIVLQVFCVFPLFVVAFDKFGPGFSMES